MVNAHPGLPATLRAHYPYGPHYLELGPDLRMHYVDEGAGPPVLMLHGNPTWSFMYRRLVQALAPELRCIAPDHIGCGLSDKPQRYPYRLATHVDNVRRLVDALGLERFDLVVHDWGGAIGMGLATAEPSRVRRIVVTNTAAFPSRRIPWRIALCKLPLFGDLAIRGFNAFAGAATFMAVEKPLPPDVRNGFLLPYRNWHDRIANLRFVQDIPLGPGHPSHGTLASIAGRLPSLAAHPMLLCWGMRDWCFSPHFLDEWRRRFPDAQVRTWPGAGHYVFEDAGDEVVTAIRDFLRG